VKTSDNFNDAVVDPRLWDTQEDGPGASVEEQYGHLEISFAGKQPVVTPGPFTAGISTRCRFSGDFDVKVDYRLLDWTAGDGVIAMLTAPFPPVRGGGASNAMSIGRASLTGDDGEGYTAYAPPGWTQRRASGDQRGSLRITRDGEKLTTYYRVGTRWRRLYAFARSLGAPGGVGPATVALQLFSPRDAFGWSSAGVALDNFWIAADHRRCG
jgi:hypothetical protein